MRKILYLLSVLLLAGCTVKSQPSSSWKTTEEEPETIEHVLIVDYQDDGGANIPTAWNDDDDENTVRKADYLVGGVHFSLEFVGKWYLSTAKEEYQTKKTPTSYIRSACDIFVKKIKVEVFEADVGVYRTDDHTGDEVAGSETDANHNDGTAYMYKIDSKDWSVLAVETYKGSSINIYSFTFYF